MYCESRVVAANLVANIALHFNTLRFWAGHGYVVNVLTSTARLSRGCVQGIIVTATNDYHVRLWSGRDPCPFSYCSARTVFAQDKPHYSNISEERPISPLR